MLFNFSELSNARPRGIFRFPISLLYYNKQINTIGMQKEVEEGIGEEGIAEFLNLLSLYPAQWH